jgi:2-(1,2-epoxy-1,2-dihydrophenyl)acetyl-CoA isomerase
MMGAMTDAIPTPEAPAEPPVLLETSPSGVATVRLNRPDAMNSLDVATKDLLLQTLRSVAEDPEVRCVVLTGSGRAFCVGQDLREHVGLLKGAADELFRTVPEHYNPIVELIATMPKPVIAAINGVAAGAGAAFAFAADFRLMVQEGGINLAFAGIALSCDSGSSWSLPRLVVPARAKELLLLPRTVPSGECLDLGLVTRVLPADELDAAVDELAETLAAGPTLAYGCIRRAIAHSAAAPLSDALAREGEYMALTGASADHHAAVDAFLAKEKPVFTGR